MIFDTDLMLFLPYTPRADSDARGYEAWLREVDAPFFNSVPGIIHYSNWKCSEPTAGQFTHFDFLYLDPAMADQVWSNPEVIAFAAGWTEKWGIDPKAEDLAINYNSYRLRLCSGQATFDPTAVRIAGSQTKTPRFGGAVWAVEASVVGTSPLPCYEFAFGSAAHSEGPADSRLGTLIAAPNQ
ncbi:hypothetical protein [Polymorphobacter sp.]|uniref:hypothetical protein n=1 Tax=Polymorphobacter sp. TaxID=1909290 RepID=UPI003F71C0AE